WLVERERFPAGEAFFEAVPERDLVLADLPAEQDFLPLAQRGEVEETAVQVLHLDTELLELLDTAGDRLALALELLLERPPLLGIGGAGVSRDPLHEPGSLPSGIRHRAAVLD